MNVCYIITSTIKCGPVNMLYAMLKDYKKISGFKPYIITLKDDEPERSRRQEFKKLGIDVCQFNFKDIKKIEKYLDENNISIIHSHGLKPDVINHKLAKTDKLVHISTLHNFPFEDYVYGKGIFIGILMSILQLYVIKNLYKVACSYSIKNQYMHKLGIKVDAIENGVIYPLEKQIERKQKNERTTFLYLGDIHKRKNLKFLVKYFQKHPEFIFLIVGDGNDNYYQEIIDRVSKIKNIKLCGRTSNPSKYYLKADFLISDSMSEGLSMSVLEALSYGLPVILSDIPSHNETLFKDNWGILFHLNNEDDLNKKILKILNKKISNKAIYQESEKKFNSEIMMNKYIKLYKKLLKVDD